MKPTRPSFLRMLALPLALAGALAGCASMQSPLETKNKTVRETEQAKLGPERAPHRSITGFSAALRCMDNMMFDYGVRDLSMLVEEIGDNTKKVNAGTRDMLITAVSDMTKRSRALRLVAYGKDATNVISFLQSAQRLNAYQVIPTYDIKGSVTQLDENVIRNQKDLGVGFQPFINLGISRDAASSVLGLDLSVLTTDDMSILPGVTSRNSVVILKQGKGFDGDAAYHKFGINYSMSLSKSEGQSQALRGLVELAVIELAGKLTKIPYWSCLGGDPAKNEEIRTEMADWYFAMASRPPEIIGYFQNQMRRRGFYRGPIDGRFNPAIDEAIANYREQLGLTREAVIDQKFFDAFLTADHSKVKAPAQPATLESTAPQAAPAPQAALAPQAAAAPAPQAAPQASAAPVQTAARPQASAPAPLTLAITSEGNRTQFQRGELVRLSVRPSRDAFVYCYLRDENGKVTRFFPNRFVKDALVTTTRPLQLPGSMRFQIVMNGKGATETVSCFAAARDVMQDMPATVVGHDFEPLTVGTVQPIRDALTQASNGAFAEGSFQFSPR